MKTRAVVLALTLLVGWSVEAHAQDARYVVTFDDHAASHSALVAAGAKIALELPNHNATAAYIPAQALKGLSHHPGIKSIEVDAVRKPSGTGAVQSEPYGISMVQADLLNDSAAGDVTVCIIDSGYDLGHEDLPTDTVSATPDAGTGDPFVDSCSHGTHVAGTIAGLDNGVGVVGVMPNGVVNLHIIKVFGSSSATSGDGDCDWAYSSDLVKAVDDCRAAAGNTRLVISMSLGGGGKNRTEEKAFDAADAAGVLSIAAAGNDGNTRRSYPASYGSVVSVAAVDANEQHADFSQRNSAVELAAPGVAVNSTVATGSGSETSVDVGGVDYASDAMGESPQGTGTGTLTDCGLGTSACTGGGVCLIQRGEISFADKVLACEAGGGVAAIIYNNEPGPLLGTMAGVATSIPSVGVSDVDGALLLNQLGDVATVSLTPSNYAAWDGTSMATPHVSGVAGLVWSYATNATNADIRNALAATAKDLGAAGRDSSYGFGLVQAYDAVLHLGVDPTPVDADGDGFSTADDCDDSDPTIYPGADESTCTGLDNDCDGLVDDDADCDADGQTVAAGDCDDASATTYLGAAELSCNGVDDDCDGQVDEHDDGDGDGYTVCGGVDCDDTNASINPGADDVCDVADMNCDGVIDACPTGPSAVSVSDIAMRYKNNKGKWAYTVYCSVAVMDDFGNPIAGATVDGTLVSASGSAYPFTLVTEAGGSTAETSLKTQYNGVFSCTVDHITHSTLGYDANLNAETTETLTIP